MKIAVSIEKMIHFYHGSLHDINHFLKVFSYAKTIGEQENLASTTQEILEVAAVVHDIACPLCREKYGNTNGKVQEKEGAPLARQFLRDLDYNESFIDRVCYLVAHHHTYTEVDGLDYQILLEADFLVNADESKLPINSINNMMKRVFKTETGIRLLRSIYPVADAQ
ncbi:MAG: HD domain-containing protein [Firmicutes bacterium]|nr:HD domain-containing protein [Bacillota bacterium]